MTERPPAPTPGDPFAPERDEADAPWHRPEPDGGDLYADLSDDADPGLEQDDGPPAPAVGSVTDAAPPARRRRRTALLLSVAAVALAAGGAGGAAGAFLVEQQRDGVLTDPGVTLPAAAPGSTVRPAGSTAAIVASVAPSVVTLEVSGGGEQGTGSGFVLDANGYVLTNNHVVSVAAGSGGSVLVSFSDGRRAKGTIVGRDVSYDLAVVKTDVRNLPALPLGDSDSVLVGDPVLAVGAPLGLQGTVTQGIISARNRPVVAGQASETSFINALQTDAAINPGNSGGPLLDGQGRVVGVNAAIARIPGVAAGTTGGSIGLGFAIPSNQARRTAEQLIRTGKAQHPVIGALLDEAGSSDGAVRIARTPTGGRPALTPGGPAESAGIKPGDEIVAIDGRPVTSVPDLVVAIRAHNPGDTVRLTVRTDGVSRTVAVKLAAADG
ncbi:MAG TPA: trypsin-like peptidase domain-containing protein [Kineosporiaceae bacterium]|nr:trypsin-like peptidase domain-containing protein [Kineosporiaceae bacterium]